MLARCQLLMSPPDAGYHCGQVDESSWLEQGNRTSIGDAIENSWLARAWPKQRNTSYIVRQLPYIQ